MEKVRKKRFLIRALFDKQLSLLSNYLKDHKFVEARGCFNVLDQHMKSISILDEEMLGIMLADDSFNDEDLARVTEETDECRSQYELIKVRLEDSISNLFSDRKSVSTSSVQNLNGCSLRLPKIELRKFSGDFQEWLPFWNQFQRIHEDSNITAVDKFFYLNQAIVPNSRAWGVLECFPPTEDNYPLAIDALKERFGREDVLIEIYVRDLLSLTLPSNKSFSLAKMYDRLECHLKALEVLGVTKGKCAAILCPLLESCMSEDFLRVWQRSYTDVDTNAEVRLEKFMAFLKNEVQNEERISVAMSGFGESDGDKKVLKGNRDKCPKNKAMPSATGLLSLNENKQSACIFCNDNRHRSTDCYEARDMSFADRVEVVKGKRCCLICMKANHIAKACKYKQKCIICNKRHVILLCPDLKREKSKNVLDSSVKGVTNQDNVLANVTSDKDSVLLPTLLVKIRGNGVEKNVRAILDTGSQRSYLLKGTALEMNYSPFEEENIIHSLFGGKRSGICKHNKYKLYLSSLDGSYLCNFDVLDQENICDELPHFKDGPWSKEFNESGLSRSQFKDSSGTIEILIGADVTGKIFTGNVIKLDCGLTAIETNLGWTLLGKIPHCNPKLTKTMIVTSMLIDNLNISDLWKLDLIGISDPTDVKSKSQVQQDVDTYFKDTLKVNEEGRYEVKLPWKEYHQPLPSNHILAEKRLEFTVKKLQKVEMYFKYQQVFEEWLAEEIIERVPDDEVSRIKHFLPHRPVIKEQSTTKVRPVFDASAHESCSPSLNDCLEKGSNLIEQIPNLLLRFRLKQNGVVADIRKAFLQISVSPDDRNYLCFLWRDELGNTIVYRHRRVVFGVVCSPYQLNAVIQHHISAAHEKYHRGESPYSESTIVSLSDSFYVDNFITSVDSEEELQILISEARGLMAEGMFDLRGWEYNDPRLEPDNSITGVLGLVWNRKEDVLSISCDVLRHMSEKVTKRSILSFSHSVFDPIGFTCPVTIEPKLILRELWSSKIGWDDVVSDEINKRFQSWLMDLTYLADVKVKRWLFDGVGAVGKLSVHTFCDASESAYAPVVFLRIELEGQVSVQLVSAKTRVAPVKYVTIPRLELLAALIGSRLLQSISNYLPSDCESFLWSDSTTVLAWIHRNEQWAPFVRNRVSEIRQFSQPEQWRHVPGTLNPADLPSRGCSARRLVASSWWEGPEWLKQPQEYWPSPELKFDEEAIFKEQVKGTILMVSTSLPESSSNMFFKYFSKYEKIVRMVGWINRFINNCRSRKNSNLDARRGDLSLEEVTDTEVQCLKLVQKESFISLKNTKISCLHPFEDTHGVVRLRTKISNRPDSEDFRFPVLLPKDHPVIKRLIVDLHHKNCHAGTTTLLAIIRERFWILGGRRTIRSVISKCIQCKRQEAKKINTESPPLPVKRVRDAAAFEVIGVDLAGPVYLKNKRKSWICLFTCGVVRAVHLELLTSLTTEEFLQAFKRFVARRGRPAVVFSDNGKNFVGADNAFKRINWKSVQEYCNVERIQWKFNPPSAPWWGGFFERMIGLMKRLLRKVLGRSALNYSEMETVLCDCESIINSRPLTYVSDDLNEPVSITPAMFIQDIRGSGVPEIDVIESIDLDKKLKHRLKLREDLRKRFRSEYLGNLRNHIKSKHRTQLCIGDIVLVENENIKRLDWPLAKVVELMPGRDGVVRLVKVKVSNGGEFLRPVQRLCLLLKNEEEEEDRCDCLPQKTVTKRGRQVKIPQKYSE